MPWLWGAVALAHPHFPVPDEVLVETPDAVVALAPGAPTLVLDLVLPEGRSLSTTAPHRWAAVGADGVATRTAEGPIQGPRVALPLHVVSDGRLTIDLAVYHCAAADCRRSDLSLVVAVEARGASLEAVHPVEVP
jgi:hypothetical protein